MFQTVVDIPEFNPKTGYHKKTVFFGSCFAENIGNKMAQLKYQTDINPFGILYNPVSVANGLAILLNAKPFDAKMLINHNGLWHSFFHHGKFSAIEKNTALERINKRIHYSSAFLKNTDYLFITFGTAWVYKYIETGQIVSNCHKIRADKFKRLRLEVDEIVGIYNELLLQLKSQNPDLKVVFTVSPIRHWKDGAIENQISKSTLLIAVNKLVNKFDFCSYFPSYEIVMDQLRDYRFYADDMIHISDLAINFIWEKFELAFIDKNSRNLSNEIIKIVKATNHRPINENTDEHLNFLKNTLARLNEFQKKQPNLNFKLEKKYFINKIEEIKNNNKFN